MSDHGRWIWYELITPDMDGAKAFYGALVGWTAQDMPPMPGSEPYSVMSAGGNGVAGMMNLGAAMKAEGMPPNWTGYLCVDDCDATAAKIGTLGGSVVREPMDIPGIGRFAVVRDPSGAVFIVMKPTPPDGGRAAPDPTALGQIGWHELMSGEVGPTFDFYAQLFGWTKAEALDMGPMGTYQLFDNQDGQVGAMMKKPDEAPMPYWLFYFRVADIDTAARTIAAKGGQVIMGPMEVPGGDWIINGTDPQGALFAVVGPKI